MKVTTASFLCTSQVESKNTKEIQKQITWFMQVEERRGNVLWGGCEYKDGGEMKCRGEVCYIRVSSIFLI